MNVFYVLKGTEGQETESEAFVSLWAKDIESQIQKHSTDSQAKESNLNFRTDPF